SLRSLCVLCASAVNRVTARTYRRDAEVAETTQSKASFNMKLFQQAGPVLKNQYDDDRVLRSYLARVLPPDVLSDVQESLVEMGRLAGGELYEMQLADRLNEPTLTQWDAWGNRKI